MNDCRAELTVQKELAEQEVARSALPTDLRIFFFKMKLRLKKRRSLIESLRSLRCFLKCFSVAFLFSSEVVKK